MNRKLLLLASIFISLVFCFFTLSSQRVNANSNAESQNVKDAIQKSKFGDGMFLVPGGNIEFGSAVDPVWGDSIDTRMITVSPFWMDETEVTNAQYREFMCWVRDSIIRTLLADPSFGGDPTFRLQPKVKKGEEPVDNVRYPLNWAKPIPWGNPTEKEELIINAVITPLQYTPDQAAFNAKMLNYRYEWFDSKSYYSYLAEMNKSDKPKIIMITKDTAYVDGAGNIVRETVSRRSLGSKNDFTNTYIVGVYPDVLCWITDFANAKNEQYVKNYLHAKAFDDYPVVGVSWEQADAYCAWRTQMFKDANPNYEAMGFEPYRFPTEAEWEFAARNGLSDMKFAWLNNDTHDKKGKANTNFKGSQNLKDLIAPVKSFDKNRFGIYDLTGNVSEWTSTSYSESLDLMTDEVNPDYSYRAVATDPAILKRKVVKGGSWKDSERFVRADVRAVEYQDKSRSYVGFRCVRSWGIDGRGKIIQ